MTKCEIIKDLLPLYMDNACSRESRELVEEHLADCRDCSNEQKLMEQNIEIEEGYIKENLDEGKLLEQGKKDIEKKVKKDFLMKATCVDIILNVLIVIFFMGKTWEVNHSAAGMMAVFFEYPYILMFIIFIVWQLVFLINEKRNKETFVSQLISGMSILCKAVIVLIVCVVSVVTLFWGIV